MTNGKIKHEETWIPNIESEVCDTVVITAQIFRIWKKAKQ